MSTYEKIASVGIGILIIVMIVFSYNEFKEPPEQPSGSKGGSHFDESLGQDFKIGSFTTVVSEKSSGEMEDNCETLQPVIIAALHDIKEHLKREKNSALPLDMKDIFEVNEPTLQLFCHKNAEITLTDNNGNRLLLQKLPFVRVVPLQSTAADIATEVRINATIALVGAASPVQPTTYGDVLIPDRFLDTATSSSF